MVDLRDRVVIVLWFSFSAEKAGFDNCAALVNVSINVKQTFITHKRIDAIPKEQHIYFITQIFEPNFFSCFISFPFFRFIMALIKVVVILLEVQWWVAGTNGNKITLTFNKNAVLCKFHSKKLRKECVLQQ